MKKLFFQIVLPLLGIAGILGFITLYNPIKAQQAEFTVDHEQHYVCGDITVHIAPLAEGPGCSTGTNPRASYYRSEMDMWVTGTNLAKYEIEWDWAQFWCSGVSHVSCADHFSDNPRILTSLTTAHVTLSSTNKEASSPFTGQACGTYQNDFGFLVFDKTTSGPHQSLCNPHISLGSDLANVNNNGTLCTTGAVCRVTPPPATPTTATVTPTGTPSMTPTGTPTGTPTEQPSASPTEVPTATPTGVNTNNCGDNNQSGNNDNNNCNNNNNQNNQNQNQEQTQNNNQTVNITLGNGQQQQEQVLGASTPTQLPSTGAESDVLFGLLALIPVGWKIRKLI